MAKPPAGTVECRDPRRCHGARFHYKETNAARVLSPGGELWTVFNSHLGYRPATTRMIGPTREVVRNTKFTITVSARR